MLPIAHCHCYITARVTVKFLRMLCKFTLCYAKGILHSKHCYTIFFILFVPCNHRSTDRPACLTGRLTTEQLVSPFCLITIITRLISTYSLPASLSTAAHSVDILLISLHFTSILTLPLRSMSVRMQVGDLLLDLKPN